ncbi:hypothetical protein [Metallibacterium sp.]|uniref:hypothetical protein n=1 Tax=Metallibacterium sp. TaxID=2940281 RepID=UPI0026314F09|nr:hypothetical protein [Metallibacterium sp.]
MPIFNPPVALPSGDRGHVVHPAKGGDDRRQFWLLHVLQSSLALNDVITSSDSADIGTSFHGMKLRARNVPQCCGATFKRHGFITHNILFYIHLFNKKQWLMKPDFDLLCDALLRRF